MAKFVPKSRKGNLRVLEVLNSYPGETFLQEHAKALLSHASEIDLTWAFTQTDKLWSISPPFEQGPPSYAFPNFDRLAIIRKGILSVRALSPNQRVLRRNIPLKILRQINPNIIHFQFASTAFKWGWIAEKSGIPFTFSLRGSDVQVFPITTPGYMERLADIGQKAIRIHAVCEDIKQQFCQITHTSAEKIIVIRTAVSQDWQSVRRMPEKGLVVSIGRLQWRKGFPDLLLAAKNLIELGTKLKLSIIGEGPDRSQLEFMIRDLGLSQCVTLEGFKSHQEIRDYLSRADIIVQSSLHEGFPNSLAEAMLAGVPIATTACNGVMEVLKPNHNAFVARPNCSGDLANIISEALQNDGQRETFSKRNQQLAKELFSHHVHAKGFEKLWII